ncbi:hypothetical protein D3C78_1701750 [compost metagenome]
MAQRLQQAAGESGLAGAEVAVQLQLDAAMQHCGQRGTQLQGGAFIGKEALPQAGIIRCHE